MMVPRLWSVNALSTEFGLDRRTVAKRIKDAAPAGELSGKPAWKMADVAAALAGSAGGDARAPDGDLDLSAERARKAKEEADKLEMQNAQLRGDLLAREDVDAAVVGAFARVRSRVIGIPSKVAPLIVGMESPAEVEAVVRRAIYDALRELSETSVAALCGDDGEMVAGAGAAPGFDGEPMGGRTEAAEP